MRVLPSSVPPSIHNGPEAFVKLVCAVFDNINARIRLLYDEDHQIGHSYFLEAGTYVGLRDVFVNKVIPLIQEYFYGSWEKVCVVLGCPYTSTGSAARNDHQGTSYAHPIVRCSVAAEVEVLGMDHEEFEDEPQFEVNPEFARCNDAAELELYFRGVLTGRWIVEAQ